MYKVITKCFWVFLLFTITLLVSCEKKVDKVLVLEGGEWMVYRTSTERHPDREDYFIYSRGMFHVKFEKDGVGKIIRDIQIFEFKWQLNNGKLQLSNLGEIPFKLISKTKDKILWERSYEKEMGYKILTDTLELTRL